MTKVPGGKGGGGGGGGSEVIYNNGVLSPRLYQKQCFSLFYM